MRRSALVIAASAALCLGSAATAHAQYGFSYGTTSFGVPSYGGYTTTVGVGGPWGVQGYGYGSGIGVAAPYVGVGPTVGYGTTVYHSGYSAYVAPGTTFVTTGYAPAPSFGYAPVPSFGYGAPVGGYGVRIGVGRVGGIGYGPGFGVGGIGRGFR